VLGILSCLFCWIPLLGLLAIPIAFIGLLLAIAGIVMANINKKTGFSFPISGGIVCILSVFIALVITGGLAAAFQKAVAQGKKTNQETESKSTNQKASEVEEWSKSLSVKQGNMKVTVQKVHIGTVNHNDALGQPQVTAEKFFAIDLAVANLSPTKKTDFQTWRGVTFGIGGGFANLTDNSGNSYKRINITPSMEDGSSYPDTVSIYPQKEHRDLLVFELPVENIEWLHLELPAENFGGSGMLRFEIPMGKISAAREEVRKAQADFESYLANKPYETNADYIRIKAEHLAVEERFSAVTQPVYDKAGREIQEDAERDLDSQISKLKDRLDKIEAGAEKSSNLEAAQSRLENVETNLAASP